MTHERIVVYPINLLRIFIAYIALNTQSAARIAGSMRKEKPAARGPRVCFVCHDHSDRDGAKAWGSYFFFFLAGFLAFFFTGIAITSFRRFNDEKN